MTNTRVVRVHMDFDRWLGNYATELSQKSGKPISKAQASFILAQNQPGVIIVRRKKGKLEQSFGTFGSL